MPIAPQTNKLARSFDVLFDPETAPVKTSDSAKVWAAAYTDYAISGGVTSARTKQKSLAVALTSAFNPALAGGGPALLIQAIVTFWAGLVVPEQASVVFAVIPTGSVNSPQPDSATPRQQAEGLAQIIAAFTLGSVKVQLTAPPNTVLPLA